ncbi:class I SAM-dependent methyltransferase [Streptosporangium sp. NPDC023615]|uniref:class I SAM-dependent methyltransferase n=1 Tax=Streptosporangium sp. NPDC023615 TaxID=3154794 RepID=UPI00343FF239
MHDRNRSSVVHQLRYALGHPGRVPGHLRRLARNTWLRLRNRDHVSYYRAVMRSDTARDPYAAVGSASHRRWAALGKMQFDYLLRHGLRPEHRLLEIGCGNLRAGRLLIGYLEPGNYHGIDISPDILIAAQETLARYRLRDRFPHLMPVRDLRFAALPDGAFDVVHAHSVFSHSPIHVIEECFRNVGRIMKPGGWFDFTFDRTEGEEHQVLGEDFYYRTETLIDLAARCGLRATFMEDWERLPHRQSKIRLTLPGSVVETGETAEAGKIGEVGEVGKNGEPVKAVEVGEAVEVVEPGERREEGSDRIRRPA